MARRKRHEEHENHERWLVSYADFITLLFAFFTVLYATSQQDVKKEQEFEKSVHKYFRGDFGFGATGETSIDPESKNLIEPPIKTFPPAGTGPQETQDYVERRMQQDLKPEEYKEFIGGIRHDAVGVRIQLAASALFGSGSSDLKESGIGPLDKVGKMLKESGRRIIIEGHTDNEPIRTEKFPSNWELSALRATKVVRYLIARYKIDEGKITALAYADQKPLVPNTSEENRTKNRRIEILITTDEN